MGKKFSLPLYLAFLLQAFSCMNKRHKLLQDTMLKPERIKKARKLEAEQQEIEVNNEVAPAKKKHQGDGHLQKGNANSLCFDFASIIQALREAADQKRGIKWKLAGDMLLRDATEAYDNVYAAEDYAVQIINIYRAAKKMCELYGESGALFVDMANEFMHQYKQPHDEQQTEYFWINKVQSLNRDTVFKLQQILFIDESEGDVNKKLRLAENYVGLDDTHYNVTTAFKVGDKKFAVEDKKWLTLTVKQQSEFRNRKSADWYQRLDPLEQKLIDAYLNKFLDGTHFIPAQIRNIPGCRNAYKKRILAYNTTGHATVLGHYYHSGALASFVQEPTISEQIASSNWEQICKHAPDIEVISLNNNVDIPIFGIGEQFIVEQTHRIVGDAFMYLPINSMGALTTPMFRKNINKLLQETSDFYRAKYPYLCKRLTKMFTLPVEKDMLQAKIQQITDAQDKIYFNKLSLLKEAAENSDGKNKLIHNLTRGMGNYYADIGSDYITCKTVLDQRKGKPFPPILFSCKSGKDRTGFMSYLVDGNIIHVTNPTLDIDKCAKIYRALASASHQQCLASLNGGMPGRFGMKPVRQNETARFMDISKQLFPKAAALTVIPY